MDYIKFTLKIEEGQKDKISKITHGVSLLEQALILSVLQLAIHREGQGEAVFRINRGNKLRNIIYNVSDTGCTFNEYYRGMLGAIKPVESSCKSNFIGKDICSIIFEPNLAKNVFFCNESDYFLSFSKENIWLVYEAGSRDKNDVWKLMTGIAAILNKVTQDINASINEVLGSGTVSCEISADEISSEPVREEFVYSNNKKSDQGYDELEKELTGLWKTVLHIKKCPVDKAFFDLGGDSISVFRLKSLVEERWQCEIAPVEFFDHSTIKEFAVFLREYINKIKGV